MPGTLRHALVRLILGGGRPSPRHPAYVAAAQIAELAHPEYKGLYDEDATVAVEALRAIRRHAEIPGHLGEVLAIAAGIAAETWCTGDFGAALLEVSANYRPSALSNELYETAQSTDSVQPGNDQQQRARAKNRNPVAMPRCASPRGSLSCPSRHSRSWCGCRTRLRPQGHSLTLKKPRRTATPNATKGPATGFP